MDARNLGGGNSTQLSQAGSLQLNSSQNLAGSPTSLQNQNYSPINNPNAKLYISSSKVSVANNINSDQLSTSTSLAPLYIGGLLTILFLVAVVALAIKNGAKQPESVNK